MYSMCPVINLKNQPVLLNDVEMIYDVVILKLSNLG